MLLRGGSTIDPGPCEEHRVLSLAITMLRMKKYERQNLLAAMEKRHGPSSTKELKQAMIDEHKRQKQIKALSVNEMRETLKQAARSGD